MLKVLNKKNLFYLIAIGLLIIVFHYTKILTPVEGLIIRGLNPVRGQIYKISRSTKSYFYTIFHYEKIKSENNDLKEELRKHIIDFAHLESLENENEVLKEELNYFKTSPKKLILAEIISGFYLGEDNLLIINRGLKDGVEEGMAVIFGSGIIVGKIIRASDWTSDVLLLSDKNSLITATIQGGENINGVIKGDLDYGLEMDYIPVDIDIKEGDIIVSSGLEDNIPKDLVIGQIKEIILEEGDFFKTAIVYPLVDYQNMDFVSIILEQ